MPGKPYPKPKKLLSKTSLRAAWDKARKLGKKFSSYGIDGKSGEEFAAHLDDNLSSIANAIGRGEYRFRDLRCSWIDKKGGSKKQRLICIPTVSDRLVQRTIATFLEKTDKLRVKNGVSYGFQEGLGVRNAVSRAVELRNSNLNWVVKTDVISFFDRIDRKSLSLRLAAHVPPSLYPLIEQVINCEAKPRNKSDREKLHLNEIKNGVGLRQGMPLSPLLSNFEMRGFDARAIKNKLNMVRYADDLVVFCRTEADAKKIFRDLESWLNELGHKLPSLHDEKSKIVPPNEGVDFLGLEIAFSKITNKYELVVSEKTMKKVFSRTRQLSSLSACEEEKWDFAGFVKGMKSRNSSLVSTYSNATNINEFRNKLYVATNESTRSLLKELFGAEVVNRISDKKLQFLGFRQPE